MPRSDALSRVRFAKTDGVGLHRHDLADLQEADELDINLESDPYSTLSAFAVLL